MKARAGVKGISESRLVTQDSAEGFLTDAGPEQLDSDTDGEEGGKNITDKNTGVLGMLYQFSKAQTERGAGVNI